jgi:molybdate transport system regulatory protein
MTERKSASRAKPPAFAAEPRPRLRILFGGTTAIGPGKADLLEAIGETGSISAAGRSMRMSYRRAWVLVDEMNAAFIRPLVASKAGGSRGGGAALTRFGHDVLKRYRAMEGAAASGAARQFQEFSRLLSPRKR